MTSILPTSGVLASELFSPGVLENPYPFYGRLRSGAPVCGDGPYGSFLVSRHSDTVFVLKNPWLFSSSIMARADRTLLGNDPPAHTRIRRIVNRAFSPELARQLEASIRKAAAELVQQMRKDVQSDVVLNLAVPLPLIIISELLGIGAERHNDFRRWSRAVVTLASGLPHPEQMIEMEASVKEFNTFFDDLIDDRRRSPVGDFISELMDGQNADESLSAGETRSLIKLLLIAGIETTTNLIGNSVLALLQHPDQLALARADPSCLPGVVEETLRYDTPVQFVQRRATRGVKLSGVAIPLGAPVLALLGSANRDERQFSAPERFDIRRRSNNHLAFGFGAHFCLGASLARQEAVIALTELLAGNVNLSAVERLDRVPRNATAQLRGPARLTLNFSN